MCSVVVIVLLPLLAQAHGKEVMANHTGNAQDNMDQLVYKLVYNMVDKLVDTLADRALKASHLSHTKLDDSTLGKPGTLAIPSRTASIAAPGSSSLGSQPRVAIPPRNNGLVRRQIHGVCHGLRTGFVGLPNVGKSTLFNAVMKESQAQAANYPFCTIEPNVGKVPVPDQRLDVLTEFSSSKSTVPTTVGFVDIAGLVKGASEGEGLGNKFLSHIREVDAIVHVVRCFEDDDIIHVDGSVDPVRDIDVIGTELALSDLDQIERRLEKVNKVKFGGKPKPGEPDPEEEKKVLAAINEKLGAGLPARQADVGDDGFEIVKGLQLLTMKPVIYAANVAESDLKDGGASNKNVQNLKKQAEKEGSSFVLISARMEEELVEFDENERKEYLEELGIQETGLESLIRVAYDKLGLRTYFTTGEKETKAWTINAGMTAPQAAGVIHTDFEKGFIRAETIAYNDFVETGSYNAAKTKGLMRSEGKEYIVQEGDVILFRFNV